MHYEKGNRRCIRNSCSNSLMFDRWLVRCCSVPLKTHSTRNYLLSLGFLVLRNHSRNYCFALLNCSVQRMNCSRNYLKEAKDYFAPLVSLVAWEKRGYFASSLFPLSFSGPPRGWRLSPSLMSWPPGQITSMFLEYVSPSSHSKRWSVWSGSLQPLHADAWGRHQAPVAAFVWIQTVRFLETFSYAFPPFHGSLGLHPLIPWFCPQPDGGMTHQCLGWMTPSAPGNRARGWLETYLEEVGAEASWKKSFGTALPAYAVCSLEASEHLTSGRTEHLCLGHCVHQWW